MDALTKQQKIDLTVLPLRCAVALYRNGQMSDEALMVMNETAFRRLQVLDPEKARELMARMTDGANR